MHMSLLTKQKLSFYLQLVFFPPHSTEYISCFFNTKREKEEEKDKKKPYTILVYMYVNFMEFIQKKKKNQGNKSGWRKRGF